MKKIFSYCFNLHGYENYVQDGFDRPVCLSAILCASYLRSAGVGTSFVIHRDSEIETLYHKQSAAVVAVGYYRGRLSEAAQLRITKPSANPDVYRRLYLCRTVHRFDTTLAVVTTRVHTLCLDIRSRIYVDRRDIAIGADILCRRAETFDVRFANACVSAEFYRHCDTDVLRKSKRTYTVLDARANLSAGYDRGRTATFGQGCSRVCVRRDSHGHAYACRLLSHGGAHLIFTYRIHIFSFVASCDDTLESRFPFCDILQTFVSTVRKNLLIFVPLLYFSHKNMQNVLTIPRVYDNIIVAINADGALTDGEIPKRSKGLPC